MDARAARWGLTFVRQVEGLRLNFQHVGAREAHSRPGSHHRFSRHLCFRAPDQARVAPAAHCVLPLAPLPSSAELEITVTVPAASEPATAIALLAYPWRAPSRFDNTTLQVREGDRWQVHDTAEGKTSLQWSGGAAPWLTWPGTPLTGSVAHPMALVATSEVLGGRGLVETGGARLGQHGTRSVVQEQKVRRE